MAISLNGNGAGRRRFHGTSALSEINVTPFVDIALVLLIIFMLTAHVMEFGIEVDVPKVSTGTESGKELPVVSITRTGDLFLNDKPVNINQLGNEVLRRFGANRQVYLRADRETTFDPVAQVMSVLGRAHLQVNVVTEPLDAAERKQR